MKNYNNIISFLFFFLFLLPLGMAQKFVGDIRINDSNQTHLIVFKNGAQKEGRIISIVNTELTFLSTENKETSTHHLSDILKVMVKGAVEEFDTNDDQLARQGLNRLFYQETGFALKAGEVQYTTYWGIIHKIDYAPVDGLTIGTGIVYPGFFTIQTKLNVANTRNSKRARVGLNLNIAAKPSRIFDDFLEKDVTRWRGFIQFGLYSSFGNTERNVHVGINVTPLFNETDFFGSEGVVSLNFGGTIRVARHWRVIYENVLGGLTGNSTAGNVGLFTALGISWFDEKRIIKVGFQPDSLFGFLNFPLSNTISMHRLPVLSFSRNF